MGFIERLQRSSVLLVALSLLVGFALLTQPAMAADRPGTPNDVGLQWCPENNAWSPRVCGRFHNTAPERVFIEMEFTKNGQPAKADKMSCGQQNQSPATSVCWTRAILQEDFDRTKELRFDVRDLDFDAQYCARFRARRTSDEMVSEKWSAWACAKTPARPAGPPKAPQFKIDFTTGSNFCRVQNVIEITHTDFEEYSELKTTISSATGPDSGRTVTEQTALYYKPHIARTGMKPDCFQAPLDRTWVYVEVCSYNVAGKSCSHKVASASAKVVLDPPPPNQRPIKLTGAPRDPTFQPDVNLPGMDYRNQPMVDNNDPQACQAMCNAEDTCKAWTWVKPAVQGPHAVCWLKRAVPQRAWGMYTISGVKSGGVATAPPPAQTPANANPPANVPNSANTQTPATNPPPASGQSGILTGVDMPGKDYRRVELNMGAAPAACQSLCAQEAPCKAWTWVRYNPQTAKPLCWLKNDVPPRVTNPDVASGLKVSVSGSSSRSDFRRRVQ